MSPKAVRFSAVPLGLLVFGLLFAVDAWVQPVTWRYDLGVGFLIMAGAMLGAIAIPFTIFTLLTFRTRAPAGFTVTAHGFVVPPSPVFLGAQTVLWLALSENMVPLERVRNGDSMQLTSQPERLIAAAVFLVLFWTGAALFATADRPRLTLDPVGITIRRLRGTDRVSWEELAPGGPPPPQRRRLRRMTLYRRNPVIPANGYPHWTVDLPVGWLHIDPTFLAARIRHYVEHPESRASIGMVSTQP